MKKLLWITVICAGGLAATIWRMRSCSHAFWERTLAGPFTGTAFIGDITTAPTSMLAIPSHGQLEVHDVQSQTNSIVLLRSADGGVQWSRLFVPEKKQPDGTVRRAGLRNLRLLTLEQRSTNYVVFIACDWDWGGKEGGIIELGNDYVFRSFSLSW